MRRRSTGLSIVVVGLLVAACGNPPTPAPSTATSSPAASASASPQPSPSASPSPAASPSGSSNASPGAGDLSLRTLVDGLKAPLAITNAGDGSDRLFVVEQAGRIRIIRDGVLAPNPFLDIAERITSGGERGLLGLAFPPGFGSDTSEFYVDYTDLRGDTVIAGFTVPNADPDTAEPGSERVLLRIAQPFSNHNGGALAFGPDGDLYVGMGDGGSGGDPFGNGQSRETLLGKILRISVTPNAGKPYTVPSDNPFADGGGEPEIWSTGMRNPWRLTFDRETGDLWIGDVGQGRWEEVDHAPASGGGGNGTDFGWNTMEGRSCFSPSSGCDQTGLALPVAVYGHDVGCSITGGYVYRGTASPGLVGTYLFSDYCTGHLWAIAADGPDEQEPALLAETDANVSSFGEDEAGELYLADLSGGRILRVSGNP